MRQWYIYTYCRIAIPDMGLEISDANSCLSIHCKIVLVHIKHCQKHLFWQSVVLFQLQSPIGGCDCPEPVTVRVQFLCHLISEAMTILSYEAVTLHTRSKGCAIKAHLME